MGCGATKLQSHVKLPRYHGNDKSSVGTCSVSQNDDDHSTAVSINAEEEADELPQLAVVDREIRGDDEMINKKEDHQLKVVVEEQVVDKQRKQDINNTKEFSSTKAVKLHRKLNEATQEQQTSDIIENSNHNNAFSESVMEDSKEVAITAVADTQTNACEHHYNNNTPLAYYNDLTGSPQQYCSNARSLSQSPRIVSLQVELGFVSVTGADLDMLQSKLLLKL